MTKDRPSLTVKDKTWHVNAEMLEDSHTACPPPIRSAGFHADEKAISGRDVSVGPGYPDLPMEGLKIIRYSSKS